jgi:hypothetical protein
MLDGAMLLFLFSHITASSCFYLHQFYSSAFTSIRWKKNLAEFRITLTLSLDVKWCRLTVFIIRNLIFKEQSQKTLEEIYTTKVTVPVVRVQFLL